jgi:uncharacterized LabA/DUF88 family protein
MTKRICIFIDGENLRHSICDLFEEEFNKNDYLPHSAKWQEFFDFLVAQTDTSGERIRTYWYVIQHLDFFPYRFPDAETKTDELKEVLSKHEPIQRVLGTLTDNSLKVRMKSIVKDLQNLEAKMNNRFKGWDTLQNTIAIKHKAVEFRRAGAIRYDLFTGKFGKEKAVDVKLACDLITLTDIYDIAIIVSGDQDYVPAVQIAKDKGKHVINVAFLARNGEILPGGARRLNQITDWSYQVPYETLKSYLNITTHPTLPLETPN